jgi:hypothetical protein
MLSFYLLFACRSPASQPAPSPVQTPTIEVRDDHNGVDGELRVGHPCRTRIGPIELQIGGPPLVAQLGDTRLAGTTAGAGSGTTLTRDGQPMARVATSSDGSAVDIFDPSGAQTVHIDRDGSGATISDPSGRVLHRVVAKADALVLDESPTIHGTRDAVLAALFTAPEVVPEVRMLAGCERTWRGELP